VSAVDRMARFMEGRRSEGEGGGNLERVNYPWNEVRGEWIIIGRRYQVFAAVLLNFQVFFDVTLCPWMSGSQRFEAT